MTEYSIRIQDLNSKIQIMRDDEYRANKPNRNRLAVVVPITIRSRQALTPQRPVTQPPPPPITQDRLRKGLELSLEELRVTRALREFRLQMQADLAAGAEIEPGELSFDPECKVVHRAARTNGG